MISPKNVILALAVSAAAMFAVAAPASAAPVSAACVSAENALQNAKVALNAAEAQYRADKLAGVPVATLNEDVRVTSQAQATVDKDKTAVSVECGTVTPTPLPRPRPNPHPIVTIGGTYPVPGNEGQREHLIQVCIDNNQGLLTSISASVLAQDCRNTVPRCPVIPPPCQTCTTTPTPTPTVTPPAPTTVIVPPPPPVVIPGPTTVIEQPPATVFVPQPGSQIGTQAPSGSVSTGALTEADRYLG